MSRGRSSVSACNASSGRSLSRSTSGPPYRVPRTTIEPFPGPRSRTSRNHRLSSDVGILSQFRAEALEERDHRSGDRDGDDPIGDGCSVVAVGLDPWTEPRAAERGSERLGVGMAPGVGRVDADVDRLGLESATLTRPLGSSTGEARPFRSAPCLGLGRLGRRDAPGGGGLPSKVFAFAAQAGERVGRRRILGDQLLDEQRREPDRRVRVSSGVLQPRPLRWRASTSCGEALHHSDDERRPLETRPLRRP